MRRRKKQRAAVNARHPAFGGLLIEASITLALVVLLLYVIVSSTTALSSSSEFGHKRLDLTSRCDRALDQMIDELQQTSVTDVDPITAEPFLTVGGAAGQRTVRFRRMVGLADNGAEVLGMWSTPIEFLLDGDRLVRRQDGQELLIAQPVQRLEFEVDAAGRLEVEVQMDAPELRSAADSVSRARLVSTL